MKSIFQVFPPVPLCITLAVESILYYNVSIQLAWRKKNIQIVFRLSRFLRRHISSASQCKQYKQQKGLSLCNLFMYGGAGMRGSACQFINGINFSLLISQLCSQIPALLWRREAGDKKSLTRCESLRCLCLDPHPPYQPLVGFSRPLHLVWRASPWQTPFTNAAWAQKRSGALRRLSGMRAHAWSAMFWPPRQQEDKQRRLAATASPCGANQRLEPGAIWARHCWQNSPGGLRTHRHLENTRDAESFK